MGTTRTTTAITTITFTEAELNPYVASAPARRRLTGPGRPGRPGDGPLMTIEAPRAGAPGTVPDVTGRPDTRPAADLRDRRATGGILGAGRRAAETVLLDGMTGEISTTYFFHDRLGLMDAPPLAPSLEKLFRCATAVDELAALRGQFACYAGRLGREAVAEASRRLLAVFEAGAEGPGDASALFWKLAAVIRPLALVAGPVTTSGLALDLPVRLLDEEFGSAGVLRFEDVDLPAALAHAPTRRFLRATGLPEEAVPFALETDLPLRTLAEHHTEHHADDRADDGADDRADHRGNRLPAHADRLIRLGSLAEDTSLVLDGATGAVLSWNAPGLTLRPLNADISTLAFSLWLLRRERALDAVRELTEAYGRLADTMSRTLATVDRVPPPDPIPCDATQAAPTTPSATI
ncbi:SUKH-4 family immunity protein [Streptomyces sp. NBC_00199]|uniref:SUKH-4 family immunity protein n=1 Tax=Streptomyces sp. NBC_00199 TaxID=2975678 RepID=UPI002254CE6B|nr:SUKH-4 family immunity protein [Streptomyces sp. NBC_00199]MCX5263807.1 SUKH-4 family immunity protein [Streptomyces sp. NBC_00199]